MKISFNNPYLEQLAENDPIGKPVYPQPVVKKFRYKMSVLAQAESIRALSRIKGLNLEALKGGRAGAVFQLG